MTAPTPNTPLTADDEVEVFGVKITREQAVHFNEWARNHHVPAPAGERDPCAGHKTEGIFNDPCCPACPEPDLGELLSTYDFMAPPQPKGEVEAAGDGWIVFDDEGEEYCTEHPDEQGREGYESVRRSTTAEDTLHALALERHEALTASQAREARAVEALELILPLAKGYAAANRVGSNAEYIEHADATLQSLKEQPDDR